MNSQNDNANSSSSELIETKRGVYFYKEERISSFKEMKNIFEEHNAEESVRILRKKNIFAITGGVLCLGGGTGTLIFGSIRTVPGLVSAVVSVGGFVCLFTALVQPKKAVAAYNNMINNGKRTSFVPTFNSDAMGNHIGIAMRF